MERPSDWVKRVREEVWEGKHRPETIGLMAATPESGFKARVWSLRKGLETGQFVRLRAAPPGCLQGSEGGVGSSNT